MLLLFHSIAILKSPTRYNIQAGHKCSLCPIWRSEWAIGVERAKQHEAELREREELRVEQQQVLKAIRDKGSRILSGD